jgi:hypothetical protein
MRCVVFITLLRLGRAGKKERKKNVLDAGSSLGENI